MSLTLQDGKLKSEIVEYSSQDEKDVEEFLNEYPDLNEELKHIGDWWLRLSHISVSRQITHTSNVRQSALKLKVDFSNEYLGKIKKEIMQI